MTSLMKVAFKEKIKSVDQSFINRLPLRIIQVNVGNKCNMRCLHCHVGSGPEGEKLMSRKVIDDILQFLTRAPDKLILDVTGGCPELNPNFRYLLKRSKPLTQSIIVRNNLTIFFEREMEDLPDFYKENKIRLICSLPCYTKENVEKQRGQGSFDKSIEGLKVLNRIGYGQNEDLQLDLVYNPGGAFLPGDQGRLERDYKKVLQDDYGVVFNHLLTITNTPINRFRQYLEMNGTLDDYMNLLVENFNRDVAGNIMCRDLLSVSWDGTLYDCDFNQALGLAIKDDKSYALNITDISAGDLSGREIIFKDHCFSCTAGSGSSCRGALAGA